MTKQTQPRRMDQHPIMIEPNYIRAISGRIGFCDREIDGKQWEVAFYVGSDSVRMTRDGHAIAWEKAPAKVRKFAHVMADQLKRMFATTNTEGE